MTDGPHANRRSPLGVLITVIAVATVIAMFWPIRDGCQPFSGARLGTGDYQLSIEGNLEGLAPETLPHQWSGRASLDRTSAWAGPDGYGIWLARPHTDGGFNMQTRRRPKPGTYRVIRHTPAPAEPPDGEFVGLLILTNDAATIFDSDSGTITIERTRGASRGSFEVFVSDNGDWRGRPPRALVVKGEFTLSN